MLAKYPGSVCVLDNYSPVVEVISSATIASSSNFTYIQGTREAFKAIA